jgi:hypothetical protein
MMSVHNEIPLARISADEETLRTANRVVLWGWKRDVGDCFRVVYFSGDLEISDHLVNLGYRHFFYRHRLPLEQAEYLHDSMVASHSLRDLVPIFSLTNSARRGLADLTVTFGSPRDGDLDKTKRLQRRRPRRRLNEIAAVQPAETCDFGLIFPADLYVGSGVSYEAGLPTLCEVHKFFGVDRDDGSDFTVGSEDPLPIRLASDPIAVLADFCRVHTMAFSAEPTPAMWTIKRLHDDGLIQKVFTDNVDNLLAKVGVPYERTRGSGVFNERYTADFKSPNLIVIGVAADRRMLVSQARRHRARVIVVNPCTSVAPRVRHLDYLRENDLFLKITAGDFFDRVNYQRAESNRSAWRDAPPGSAQTL